MNYRKLETKISNDAKFRSLSDDAKLLFYSLFFHSNSTSLGAMKCSIPGTAAEMGWTEEKARKAFYELSGVQSGIITEIIPDTNPEKYTKPSENDFMGLIKFDEKACYLEFPNYLKYNKPQNTNVVKSWSRSWDLIPECEMKFQLYQRLKEYTEGLGQSYLKSFLESFPIPTRNDTPPLYLYPKLYPKLYLEPKKDIYIPPSKPKRKSKKQTDNLRLETNDFIVKEIFEFWNYATPPEIAKISSIKETRRNKIEELLIEYPNILDWKKAIRRLSASEFCRGKKEGGWSIGFDWFIKEDNFIKCFEGNYNNPPYSPKLVGYQNGKPVLEDKYDELTKEEQSTVNPSYSASLDSSRTENDRGDDKIVNPERKDNIS